jgi:hypothetical protein
MKLVRNNTSIEFFLKSSPSSLGSTDGLPKVSLKKLDAYQRALLIGSNIDEE